MSASATSYHHGDLRAALIRAGLDLSRADGARAVVLREATRRAGVTARAAYRHFADRDALMRAVAAHALQAMSQTIRDRQAGATTPLERLQGVGEGYIAFALRESGWFDVAFFAMDDMGAVQADGALALPSPHQLLLDALDEVAATRGLDRDWVERSAILCWSGVHGFATLVTQGPLRSLPPERILTQARLLVEGLVGATAEGAETAGRAVCGHHDPK